MSLLLTLLSFVNNERFQTRRQCYTILLSSWTLVGKRLQRFPPGTKFMFTFGVNPLSVLCWLGNNSRELCCILRSCCLYSAAKLQPILYINCLVYCCYLLRFPSLHLTHSPIPERGYATLTTTDMPTLAGSDLTSPDLMVVQ